MITGLALLLSHYWYTGLYRDTPSKSVVMTFAAKTQFQHRTSLLGLKSRTEIFLMGEKALYFPHTMRNPKVPCNYIVFGLSAGVACRIWRKTSGQMFISACNLAYSNMSPLIYLQQIQSSSFYDAPTLSSLLSHSS